MKVNCSCRRPQRGAGALEPFWAQVGTITSAHALVFLSMCYFETQAFSAFPEALKSTSIVSAGPEMDFGLITAPLLRGSGSRVTCLPASSLSSFSPQLGHTHFWILASPLSLSPSEQVHPIYGGLCSARLSVVCLSAGLGMRRVWSRRSQRKLGGILGKHITRRRHAGCLWAHSGVSRVKKWEQAWD